MTQKFFLIAVTGLFAMQIQAQDKPAVKQESALKTQKEKASYSIGYEMSTGMKEQKLDVDPEIILKGLQDGFAGKKALLTPEEMKEVMEVFEKDLEARMQKETLEVPEKNRKEGSAFLAENKKKEGVKVHPVKLADGTMSELQYKVIKEGTGPSPKPDDRVTTHYRGTLLNGTEFDSSYKRNEPTSFGVRQVIKGWQEALQLMKGGSKWQLFIPGDLAYGAAGAGRDIAPNATLIFDIELISIEPKQ